MANWHITSWPFLCCELEDKQRKLSWSCNISSMSMRFLSLISHFSNSEGLLEHFLKIVTMPMATKVQPSSWQQVQTAYKLHLLLLLSVLIESDHTWVVTWHRHSSSINNGRVSGFSLFGHNYRETLSHNQIICTFISMVESSV